MSEEYIASLLFVGMGMLLGFFLGLVFSAAFLKDKF